jgi:hypothetical protein
VAQDITKAILKTSATDKACATYWSKEEQEQKLQAAYEKWSKESTVWSAAASKVRLRLTVCKHTLIYRQVHCEQMKHVRKGCLARPREDIPSDGSRIEGSHKAWNGIQRSFSSGLVMFRALGHDFVLRRNRVHQGFWVKRKHFQSAICQI